MELGPFVLQGEQLGPSMQPPSKCFSMSNIRTLIDGKKEYMVIEKRENTKEAIKEERKRMGREETNKEWGRCR